MKLLPHVTSYRLSEWSAKQSHQSEVYLRKDDLVDDNAAAIHLKFGQLLDQPFRLIQAQELRYAHAYKGSELRIPELAPNLVHHILHHIAANDQACTSPHA